jgi:16S rRNA (guanine527-N7)-methyltransferase
MEANPLLHLVAPCPPEEFATRHVLESLSLLKYLPPNARFGDVGPGAGFPSIPCLLVRNDLKARLIESKVKKASFLESAVKRLGLDGRAAVVNKQFEETSGEDCSFVVCRALDKFAEKLPKLLKWSGSRKMLFFGGNNLRMELEKRNIGFSADLMPMSEQRFLFVLNTGKS